MGDKIIFHTTHCPKCKVLEMKLKSIGAVYEENNDTNIMLEKGLMSAPALEVNGVVMEFKEALDWIKKREDNK